MINRIFSKCITNKHILSPLRYKFSASSQQNPNPDQNNQNNQLNNKQVKNSQKSQNNEQKRILQDRISKALSKLKIKRAELFKIADSQLQYEKKNTTSQQLQKTAKYLSKNQIKIRFHKEQEARIQFYHVQTSKKSLQRQPKQKQSQQGKQQNQQKQAKSSDNKAGQRSVQEKEQQDYPYEMKILTSSIKLITDKQNKYFGMSLIGQDMILQSFMETLNQSNKQSPNLNEPSKGFVNKQKPKFTSFKQQIKLQIKKFIKNQNKASFFGTPTLSSSGQQIENLDEDSFQQFTIFLRNSKKSSQQSEAKGRQKWLKADIFVQNWAFTHLHKFQIIDDIQQHIKGNPSTTPNKYKGVQAKQLDGQLIEVLKQAIQKIQNLNPKTLGAIYYYTALYERNLYRQWLEDIVGICK